MTRIGSLILLVILATRIHGVDEILVTDTFDTYSVNSLPFSAPTPANTFAAGGGWFVGEGWYATQPAGSGGGGQIASGASGLELQTTGASSGQTGFVGRRFAAAVAPTDTAPAWVSFHLRTHNVQAVAGAPTVHNAIELHDSDFATAAVISLNTNGTRTTTPANGVRWRLNTYNDPSTATSPVIDDTNQLVVIEVKGSSASVWFNPSGSTPPGTAFTSISISPVSFDRFMVSSENNDYTVIDDFRIGTTWTAVTDDTMPVVTNMSPVTCTTSGNVWVTIAGANFAPGMQATFNGTDATSVTVHGTTAITALVPAGTAGTATVRIISGSRAVRLTDAFAYVTPSASFPGVAVPPSISGSTAIAGQLIADPGQWTPTQTSFDYRWQLAADAGGGGAANIVGATSATFMVKATDIGKWLRVEVTPSGASAASAATSPWLLIAGKLSADEVGALPAAGSGKCGASGLAVLSLLSFAAWRRRRAAVQKT